MGFSDTFSISIVFFCIYARWPVSDPSHAPITLFSQVVAAHSLECVPLSCVTVCKGPLLLRNGGLKGTPPGWTPNSWHTCAHMTKGLSSEVRCCVGLSKSRTARKRAWGEVLKRRDFLSERGYREKCLPEVERRDSS